MTQAGDIIASIYEGEKRYIKSEYDRRLLGVLGLSSFDQHNSASRKQMFSSHIGQCLVIKGATEKFIRTGVEDEYGKFTFKTQMPCDADIIQIIERYPRLVGADAIRHNPETLVIYEDDKTKEVGCLSVTDYFSHHQYFGFKNKQTSDFKRLRSGVSVAEGTVLADSPSVTPGGGYMYGRQCNVAFMSIPGVSEDGIVISRDVLTQFQFNTFETRTVEFGAKYFPLNTYGDQNHYKICPDIGDPVRPDGILMAFRSYDENFSTVEQSRYTTMRIDANYDKLVYAAGPGGQVITAPGPDFASMGIDPKTVTWSGVVKDIRVMHDEESSVPTTPLHMEVQARKYDEQRRRFYADILKVYDRLKHDRGAALMISREFNRLVVDAISVVRPQRKGGKDGETNDRVQKVYKAIPLDDWRIEFVIEYTITPNIGFKLTDCHGGKGVICQILEPNQMPVDEAGNRADMIFDGGATMSRMNLGRVYEQYINSASRDLAREITRALHGATTPQAIRDHANFNVAWDRLMRYYQLTSPRTYAWFVSHKYTKAAETHLKYIIDHQMVHLYYPPDNEVHPTSMIRHLEAEFRPTFGPVRYIGNSGRSVMTKDPVRIGSLYIMLLEKTGDDWTALSSGKWQNFGVLAQITARDKFASPTRQQSIRAFGETEIRILASYVGPIRTAEILDRNNSIATHKQVLGAIFATDTPSNIGCAVDRNINPLGNARPLQLAKHLALCGGWRFAYKPHRTPVPDANFAVFD